MIGAGLVKDSFKIILMVINNDITTLVLTIPQRLLISASIESTYYAQTFFRPINPANLSGKPGSESLEGLCQFAMFLLLMIPSPHV